METCCSGTSAAHTYGNMISFIRDYIISSFPKDYFKTEFISSTIGFKQLNPMRQKNREFLKKKKPILIIKPRIDVTDTDKFLYGTLLTERIFDNADATPSGNLQPFFIDKDNGLKVMYLLNRMKMAFDVTIICESAIEQINMESYFRNRVRQNHNFSLNVFLESFLPKSILRVLSEQANIPMEDSDGKVNKFLDYLNGHSMYPITYKLKDSTGNQEFFRFYNDNVDVVVTGLDLNEGTKRNQISDSFTIPFTITTEFWGVGLYYLFSEKAIPTKYDFNPSIENESHIVPLFTIPLYKIKAPDNWNTYSSTFYKVTVEKDTVYDETNFGSIIGQTLDASIKYHYNYRIPIETLMSEAVMIDGKFLVKGQDYEIDYTTYTIITKKLDPTKTYRLIIFVNTLYLNDLKKTIFGLKTE